MKRISSVAAALVLAFGLLIAVPGQAQAAPTYTYGAPKISAENLKAQGGFTAKTRIHVRSDSSYAINVWKDNACKKGHAVIRVGKTSGNGYHSFKVNSAFRVKLPGWKNYIPADGYYGINPYGPPNGCFECQCASGTMVVYTKPIP
ncbi:MAG TPA: hypothetical protein VF572_01940 [Candidatus Saccharimonadales bacterium]|jgi:hypothetical protein